KPRLAPLTAPAAERVLGALCLVLSIVLLLPIPLGNMLPAVAICGIAMGILERDGLWIAFGLAVALLSLVIVWSVLYALAGAAFFLFTRAFA
ncbi:ABC transporter permease, partial [Cereibacter changlensis JA139]